MVAWFRSATTRTATTASIAGTTSTNSRPLLLALAFGVCLTVPLTAVADEELTLDDLACPDDVSLCVGIELYVAQHPDADRLVVESQWVIDQVTVANQHFAPVGVGFDVVALHVIDRAEAEVHSRTDRDRLGRDRFAPGTIHVFAVQRLDNVDDDGEIYGVHWRDRDDRKRRWIIVSQRARGMTLAHELGHFFGLPHSDYPISIMNKTARSEPPYEDRTFHADELDIIERRKKRMLKRGMIVALE